MNTNSPFRRMKTWFGGIGSGRSTVPAITTYDQDCATYMTNVDAAAGPEAVPQAATDAAIQRIAIRGQETAAEAVHGPARRAERKTNRAKRATQCRKDFEAQRKAYLESDATASHLAQVAARDKASALMGFLTFWGSHVLTVVLLVAVALNDPLMVYATVRRLWDVPDSVPNFEVTDYRVAFSLTMALVMYTALLLFLKLAARSLATLMYRGQLVRVGNHPAAKDSADKLSQPLVAAIAVAGSLGLGWLCVQLHGYASARFALEKTLSTDNGGIELMTWSITLLPVVLLIAETIAATPQMAHIRLTHKWTRRYLRQERRDVRKDNRALRAERRTHRSARLATLMIVDILANIANRMVYELSDAALTGHADLRKVSELAPGSGSPDERPEASSNISSIDLTTWALLLLPNMPTVTAEADNAIKEYNTLTSAPDEAPLLSDWRAARKLAAATAAGSDDSTTTNTDTPPALPSPGLRAA